MRKNKILILVFFFLYGCSEKYTPKPYGYFRIDFPEKQWVQTPDSLPYTFQMAGTAYIEHDPDPDAEKGWINLHYPCLLYTSPSPPDM